MKRLIATDFDGTFYRGNEISEEDLAAVREWRAAGRYFGFVTGRGIDFLRTAKELGAEADFFLLYNGALLAGPDGAVRKEYLIPRETFALLAGFFRGCPDVRSFDEEGAREFYHQYYARFDTAGEALAAAEEINRMYGDRVTAFVNGPHVNVGKKGSGKAQGVFDALRFYGLPADAAAVFGDDYNDLEMIEAHGGWAVKNARAEVLGKAKHVCDSVGSAARALLRETE